MDRSRNIVHTSGYYYRRGDVYGWDWAVAVLNTGAVSVSHVRYKYVSAELDNESYKACFSKTESEMHSILKWCALNWLQEQGEVHPKIECGVSYGIADVFGEDLQIAIECGDTDPYKMIRAVVFGDVRSVVVFPFQRCGNNKQRRYDKAYQFARGVTCELVATALKHVRVQEEIRMSEVMHKMYDLEV